MALGLYDEPSAVGLPHPEMGLSVFLIVEEAIRVAWALLREKRRAAFDLLTADEDVVTHELYETLWDGVFAQGLVEGFNRELFTTITRESKLRNYDGETLDKMPDLLIGLIGRLNVSLPSQDWLFIECKPVDPSHSLVSHYCKKGIARFVRGEYAWAMTSALMVGYARQGYTISPRLLDALKASSDEIPTLDSLQSCGHSNATSFSDTVHISKHGRMFKYVETGLAAPSIALRHLWLWRN